MFSVSWGGTLALGDFSAFYGVFKLVHPLYWPEFPWKFYTFTMKFMGLMRLNFSCNTTHTKQIAENLLLLPLVILNYIYEYFNYWPALAFVKVHSDWLEAMDYICQKITNFQPQKYTLYTEEKKKQPFKLHLDINLKFKPNSDDLLQSEGFQNKFNFFNTSIP